MWPRIFWSSISAGILSLVVACPAVYPEIKTPVRAPSGELEPPPKDLRWVAFKSATIPKQTRDGRQWDAVGGEAPDPYAILLVNGKVLIKTPTQANTTSPTWPEGPAGNFWIRDDDRLRVELWEANPITDHPIGVRDVGRLDEDAKSSGLLRVELDTGAEIELAVEPAHARKGLGLSYELRMGEVYVTKTYEYSPSARAGLRPGDQLLTLGGKPVGQMAEGEAQSVLNVPHMEGLAFRARHADGGEFDGTLKEGAIYFVFERDGKGL